MKKLFFLLSFALSSMVMASSQEITLEQHEEDEKFHHAFQDFDIEQHIRTKSSGVYESDNCCIILDVNSCSDEAIITPKILYEWDYMNWYSSYYNKAVDSIKSNTTARKSFQLIVCSLIEHFKTSQVTFGENFDIEQCKSCLVDLGKNSQMYLASYQQSIITKNQDIQDFFASHSKISFETKITSENRRVYEATTTTVATRARAQDPFFLLSALNIKYKSILIEFLKVKLVEQNIVSPEGLSKYLIDLNIL